MAVRMNANQAVLNIEIPNNFVIQISNNQTVLDEIDPCSGIRWNERLARISANIEETCEEMQRFLDQMQFVIRLANICWRIFRFLRPWILRV